MYEYTPTKAGLGWTGGFTVPGQEARLSKQTCSGPVADPMDPSSDLVCGRSGEVSFLQGKGCRPVGFRGSHHCLTDAGNEGIFFCCPPGSLSPAVAQGMTCRFHYVSLDSLRDARSRSIWTVQNKLCQLGIDPGPVDGTENSDQYRPAIRSFQARQNIPQTGEPDLVTLRAMGLTNASVLANAIAGSALPPGVGLGMQSLLPFAMIGAFGLSGVFLFYAVKKHKRSQR